MYKQKVRTYQFTPLYINWAVGHIFYSNHQLWVIQYNRDKNQLLSPQGTKRWFQNYHNFKIADFNPTIILIH